MEQTECSETSAYKIQTPGNYPEESMQHSEQGESLKSRILHLYGEETARNIRLFEELRNETECSETSAYKIQTPGKLPRRKQTTFRTRRKFEIKKSMVSCIYRQRQLFIVFNNAKKCYMFLSI